MGFFDDVVKTVNANPIVAGLIGGPGLPVTTGLISGISGIGSAGKTPVAQPNLTAPVTFEDQQAAAARANEALLQQQNFLMALQRQGGIGNQASVFGQQQALANQLQQQALGQGPNPALAQLQQATGANTANQAALMAGQRGTGGNAGLIARQAAHQGAANQQQMAGQAATLQAQQQIAAQQALAQQQAAMGNLATNQLTQQQQALGQFGGAAQNQQQMMLNAIANQNANQLGQAGMQNQMNMANQQQQNRLIGNLLNVGGAAAGMYFGGPAGAAAGSQAGNILTAGGGSGAMENPMFMNVANQGGTIGTNQVQQAPMTSKAAAYFKNAIKMDNGGKVPGKAVKSGDNLSNDKVPAMLSPGEIVIPRSIVQGKDAAKKAAEFVAACLAKQGK